MYNKFEALRAYLEDQIARCTQQQAVLLADSRVDEANFEKIRANIYDIFHTVLTLAHKSHPEDEQATGDFFAQRLAQIPASWRVALDKARQHGEADAVCVEQIKLDTLAQVESAFTRIWRQAV